MRTSSAGSVTMRWSPNTIFEVVAAQVAATPAHPETLHYLGDGQFMVAGKKISRRRFFTKVS